VKNRATMLGLFGLFIFSISTANAAVVVDRMFSDHMVLQREMKVPVWGTADAGEEVTVSFQGQTKTATANDAGKWMVKLDPLKVGDASDLSVSDGSNKVTFSDVLVGEVWVGSGQSNMAGAAGGYAKNDEVLASAMTDGPYPSLRLYNRGGWAVADENSIKGFSAIHFSFGHALHEELQVPVGLMYGAAGGTPSGRWLSKEMAVADKRFVAQFKTNNGYDPSEIESVREKNLAKFNEEKKKLKAEGKKPPRFSGPNLFGDLYKSRIEFMVPYAIRGVLWDQGESKTQIPGVDQYTTMHALITGWRGAWGQDFHFLHVQKPSGGVAPFDPKNPINKGAAAYGAKLPANHFSQPAALKYQLDHIKMRTIANAPLVTAIDLGTGIHPACKSGYGKRACRVALGTAYGQDVEVYGPIYKSHQSEGNKIRVSFDHVGEGLAIKHAETVVGFEVAGADGEWAWADAVIEGDTIVVSSKDVAKPVHVQYAFSNRPSYANLFNKDGLPALTFTTVEWEEE
jgi:sialate O-acetylesterase